VTFERSSQSKVLDSLFPNGLLPSLAQTLLSREMPFSSRMQEAIEKQRRLSNMPPRTVFHIHATLLLLSSDKKPYQSINQSIDRLLNQSSNQSLNHSVDRLID
jgi:hypothetical protein